MDGRVSDFMQIASIRRYTLTEGRGKGLDIIDCDNGKIRFLLNVSKALDIMQLYHCGQNVSFLSKNAFTAKDLPFAERFEGGMLYTCGLDSVGDRTGFELHGSFHNTPAEVIRSECDENGIRVEAIVRSTALFGRNLVMKRTVSAGVGEEYVVVDDVLVNEGFRDENYCLLYHINVGYPMLDAGTKVVAKVTKCTPRTPWSEKNKASVFEMSAAVPCLEETCYYLEMNEPKISLVNEKAGKKLTVSYSGDTLPCFLEWKSMASGDYALGLEPSTTELDDGFRYKTVKAKASINFGVKIRVTGTQ